jgi:ADP-heptose:LPS heptosyltransferase
MMQLDLIISVDSMPIHLAGALGRPAWVLLQQHADWRWQDERNDSPWYPTVRVYRQHEQDNWRELLARVASDLRPLTA